MKFKIICKTLIVLIVASCGKKVSPSKSSQSQSNNQKPLSISLQKFIEKQSVVCEDDTSCSESVAKLVVVERDKIRYCTATLISEDIMMTSSSCLPQTLRTSELDCSKNMFAIFPLTKTSNMARSRCGKIISSNSNENIDPALWRSDFTFFTLLNPVKRNVLKVSRDGVEEQEKYLTWKVHYDNDTDSILKSYKCLPVFNSYANPFSTNALSSMVPVANCEFVEGNGGAPILNEHNEVVGIFSEKLDRELISFINISNLLNGPMSTMHFMSNLSCAKIPLIGFTNELDKECFKDINPYKLDRLRSEYLTSNRIHQKNMQVIIDKLDNSNKYFKFKTQFYQNYRSNNWEAHFLNPKCFFDIDNWINEFTRIGGFIRGYALLDFEIINYRLKTKLDNYLRPLSFVDDTSKKHYRIEFNPKNAFNMKSTYVNLYSSLFNRELNTNFEIITDKCE